ncbi:MAG: type I-C CRISPR-associated protein Cas7/Csd2 [Candidatus Margulisiibacteriota bacterium]|nr:type I-C CRISPR-associated protein Cas7/Csd2 [Candidatus Margulisiibacteriota bacterium]
MREAIKNRYEFVVLYDVENGNPNGDPDAGNMPRIDYEAGNGIITDVCIKRKVRNYVEITRDGEKGFDIYVKDGAILNNKNLEAYKVNKIKHKEKELPKDEEQAKKITAYMCGRFYDIRSFGAVMTTKVNCGQVRGPVQFAFSKSIDPIVQQEVSITRIAVTDESDKAAATGHTMGKKFIVPYALYRMEGYISPYFAKQTGFGEEDKDLLFEALMNMFEHDRSAARGKMSARKLWVFKHDTELGNAPANKLFDAITIKRKNESVPARAFSDYKIEKIGTMPKGVEIEKLL